jgi:hypothetical protein
MHASINAARDGRHHAVVTPDGTSNRRAPIGAVVDLEQRKALCDFATVAPKDDCGRPGRTVLSVPTRLAVVQVNGHTYRGFNCEPEGWRHRRHRRGGNDKSFGGRAALSGVSLQIGHGITGILGPNGAGILGPAAVHGRAGQTLGRGAVDLVDSIRARPFWSRS